MNKPMKVYDVRHATPNSAGGKDIAVRCIDHGPTNKGNPLLELHAASYLKYDEVLMLRNWLGDWLGHWREQHDQQRLPLPDKEKLNRKGVVATGPHK